MNKFLDRWLTAAIWVYITILFGWLALYLLSGDRFAAVSLINMVGVYMFLPVPMVFLAAIYLRRWEIWTGAILGSLAFLWLWGGLFLPKPPIDITQEKSLSVMTYNVLGWHSRFEPQVELIQQENPDVVFLQELNPLLAEKLESDLIDEYPYQVLSPTDGFRGMGVISKYPIVPTGMSLPLDWVGVPQVLWLQWEGQQVLLINFHMNTTTLGTIRRVSRDNRYREAQALALVEATRWGGPVVLAGDANTTSLSNAYQLFANELSDSWLEAGYGLGHTFPGSDIPGSARPSLAGFSIPQWLARIDYIFHSDHWQAVQAYTVRFDGVSDHRGVVAVLVRRGDERLE